LRLPEEAEYLLQVVAIKTLCRRANVEKIEVGPKGAVLALRDNVFAIRDGSSPTSPNTKPAPASAPT